MLGIGALQVQQLARGGDVMDLVEIDFRWDAEPVPDQRQEAERDQQAPAKGIALRCRGSLHRSGG